MIEGLWRAFVGPVFVLICVCLCAYIYVYVYFVCLSVYVYGWIFICGYVCGYNNLCLGRCNSVSLGECVYVCLWMCVYVCGGICACVCGCVCICVLISICLCIHIYAGSRIWAGNKYAIVYVLYRDMGCLFVSLCKYIYVHVYNVFN